MLKRWICFIVSVCVFVMLLSVSAQILPSEEQQTSPYIRNVYEPNTSLLLPATVIQQIDHSDKLNALQNEVAPQAAWLVVDDANYEIFMQDRNACLDEVFTACKDRVIPILEIGSIDSAEHVAEYLTINKIYDIILASDDTQIVSYLYEKELSYVRLALIGNTEDMATLSRQAHASGANICVLESATREMAEYLQKRFLTLFLKPTTNIADDHFHVINAYDCGANGVVLNHFETAYEMYSQVYTTTYVRRAFVVGHRGFPTVAPENTVEGMKEAFEAGADMVECDIWLSKDKHVVINHNGNLAGYTTEQSATAGVETRTREQLKQYTLNSMGNYTDCKISFLDEMLEVLKEYPDKILVIEVKSSQKTIMQRVRELVEGSGTMDQIVVISFFPSQLENSRQAMPEVGTSLLVTVDVGTSVAMAEKALRSLNQIHASYSPSSTFTSDALEILHHRGISGNLWTINGIDAMKSNAEKGAQFITTDTSNFSDKLRSTFGEFVSWSVWRMAGDINIDGAINSQDALLALQYSVMLTTLDLDSFMIANVNSDNDVNAQDALLILQYSVGRSTKLPV